MITLIEVTPSIGKDLLQKSGEARRLPIQQPFSAGILEDGGEGSTKRTIDESRTGPEAKPQTQSYPTNSLHQMCWKNAKRSRAERTFKQAQRLLETFDSMLIMVE